MEEVSVSSLDNSKLEGLAQDILSDLVEDACLGLCFEVHRAVKQGYFFLDDTDQESMRDFGMDFHCCLQVCSSPGEVSRNGTQQQPYSQSQVERQPTLYSYMKALFNAT
uniref:Uncharacterized protein n=1 Tax=Neogobius melanostomus TaxID=47308 RepID=A0A8C6WFE8_9GOBI